MNNVFIIAEAGVNHNGDIGLAKQLVDAALVAGADAVKFQTFKADQVVTGEAERAEYQKKNVPDKDESQLEMIKRLEISFADFKELKIYCDRKGIAFLSSPFDLESIDFLGQLNVPYFKIPSGEITNLPFLRKIGQWHKKVILSTGMATLGETEKAIEILNEAGARDLILMHCTTNYPTPPEEVNLLAMKTLQQAFGLPVGYSDHTMGTVVPVAAVTLGARVIEKHFTLDCSLEGPDHKASLEPSEFKDMIEAIRIIEKALGTGIKKPATSELQIMKDVRRSIVASCDISAGDVINESNITVKRPGTGISPMMWDIIIGRKARCDILKGMLLTWQMV
jgi:N,N'-diacetyllegionaminate synthase